MHSTYSRPVPSQLPFQKKWSVAILKTLLHCILPYESMFQSRKKKHSQILEMEKQLGKKTQKTLFSGFLLKKPKIVKKNRKKNG